MKGTIEIPEQAVESSINSNQNERHRTPNLLDDEIQSEQSDKIQRPSQSENETTSEARDSPFQSEMHQVEKIRNILRNKRVKAAHQVEMHRQRSSARKLYQSEENDNKLLDPQTTELLSRTTLARRLSEKKSSRSVSSTYSSDSSSNSSSLESDSSSEHWDSTSQVDAALWSQTISETIGSSQIVDECKSETPLSTTRSVTMKSSHVQSKSHDIDQKFKKIAAQQTRSYSNLVDHNAAAFKAEYQAQSVDKTRTTEQNDLKLVPKSDMIPSHFTDTTATSRNIPTEGIGELSSEKSPAILAPQLQNQIQSMNETVEFLSTMATHPTILNKNLPTEGSKQKSSNMAKSTEPPVVQPEQIQNQKQSMSQAVDFLSTMAMPLTISNISLPIEGSEQKSSNMAKSTEPPVVQPEQIQNQKQSMSQAVEFLSTMAMPLTISNISLPIEGCDENTARSNLNSVNPFHPIQNKMQSASQLVKSSSKDKFPVVSVEEGPGQILSSVDAGLVVSTKEREGMRMQGKVVPDVSDTKEPDTELAQAAAECATSALIEILEGELSSRGSRSSEENSDSSSGSDSSSSSSSSSSIEMSEEIPERQTNEEPKEGNKIEGTERFMQTSGFQGNFDDLYAMAMECSDSDYSDSDYDSEYSSSDDGDGGADEDDEGGVDSEVMDSVRDIRSNTEKSSTRSFPLDSGVTNPLAGILSNLNAVGGGGVEGFQLSSRHVSLFEKAAAGLTISIFNHATKKFVISNGDVDPKEIAAKMGLPRYEISRVDHSTPIPGAAFSVGYIQKKIQVRKIAIDMIKMSFEKFHYRKSFWTIVPKIPQGTKSVLFVDSERRVFRQDQSEGEALGNRSSMDFSPGKAEDGSEEEDEEYEIEAEEAEQSNFFVKRVTEHVVLVRSKEDESYVQFFDKFDIPDLRLPPGYDLLINPFFFTGENFEDEVARDTVCVVSRDGKEYAATLAPEIAHGFILCFGQAWQSLVNRVTERCKRGEEPGMAWPKFLESINSLNGPAPDYFDIPQGYWIYASSLLLGFCDMDVGIREIWAAGGLIGMYSFARRQHSSRGGYNREIATVFAMLREATYGCRSQKMGVRLLHYLPAVYHDDYVAFCTLPWSKVLLESRRMATSYTRQKQVLSKALSRRPLQRFSSYQIPEDETKCCGCIRNKFKDLTKGRIFKHLGALYDNARKDNKEDDKIKVELSATRFLVTIDNPQNRGIMNFLGAIGLEMIGIAYPTVIENYMNVISDSFSDAEDAKDELRYFCNKERMLPGAVLRAANFAETEGGVLNIIQEGCTPENGHVEWMRKYSFFDSISTLVMLAFATALGWILETGAFHFMMAITVLTRIYEEVSLSGTYYVLVRGRHYGHFMYEDSMAQFLVPALLGSVEVTFDLVPPDQGHIARWVLLIQGGLAGAIIFFTMLARLQFKDNEGRTYDEVLERDGSIECLLSGENETGFRSIDHPNGPGVGPLQAQLFNLCESNGGSDVASSSASAPYHVSGQWMIAGTQQRNHELDFGLGSPALSTEQGTTGVPDNSWNYDDVERRDYQDSQSIVSGSTIGHGDIFLV